MNSQTLLHITPGLPTPLPALPPFRCYMGRGGEGNMLGAEPTKRSKLDAKSKLEAHQILWRGPAHVSYHLELCPAAQGLQQIARGAAGAVLLGTGGLI